MKRILTYCTVCVVFVLSFTAHSATADRGSCRVLDVFHPIREDYRDRAAG